MHRAAGRLLGKYALQELLSSTGLATVYLARDTHTGETVVLKVLRPYLASQGEVLQRFMEAMERARGLRHPNIVRVVDVGDSDGEYWVALEYVPWPTLNQTLDRLLTPEEALAILRPVAEAVEYAHSQGVGYHNIKPSNVFVNPDDGRVQVSDFGMTILSEGVHPLMRTNLNTPHPTYTAPEQIQGFPTDIRSDLYSLAVLMYHMLTGEVPFCSLNPYTVLAKQLTTFATPPSQVNPSAPRALDPVLLRGLARRPEERFDSLLAFVQAVEKALAQGDGEAAHPRRPGAAARLLQEDAPEAKEVVAAATPAASPSPLEDGALVCRLCGHVNDMEASHCVRCWANLTAIPVVTRAEGERLARRYRLALWRGRLLRRGFVGAMALGLLMWGVVVLADLGPKPPKATTSISASTAAQTWAQVRRDPQNTGFTPEAAPLAGGTVKWTYSTAEPLLASPAVVGDRVYLATGDRRMVALDRETGRQLWEYPLTGPVDSDPAVAGDLVVFGLRDGRILALDQETGALRWQRETGGPILAPPVVVDGTAYIGSSDHNLYALDVATGKELWRFTTEAWIISPVAYADHSVSVLSMDSLLYTVDTETGRRRFVYDAGWPTTGAPVVQGDLVYFGTSGGMVWALDRRAITYPFERGIWTIQFHLFVWEMISDLPPQKGAVWSTYIGGPVARTPAIAHNTLYAANRDGQVVALDAATGEKRWTTTLGIGVTASLVVAGETVLVGTRDGTLYGLDSATGEQVWAFPTGDTISASPVVAGDTMYVASRDGNLYAVAGAR